MLDFAVRKRETTSLRYQNCHCAVPKVGELMLIIVSHVIAEYWLEGSTNIMDPNLNGL